VKALLGVVEADRDDLFNGVGGLLQGDAEVGALTAGEVGQDEVGGVLAARWAADAHAQHTLRGGIAGNGDFACGAAFMGERRLVQSYIEEILGD